MSRRSETTTKVFVGSLPGGVTPEDLRKLFEPYGPIAECDIANRCGFLHLEDKDLAIKAIEELNNTNFMGTRISVEKGRVKPPRSRREGGGPARGGKDRGGPYSRDSFRGPPRNGGGPGYGGRDYSYGGGDRFDYDRGMGSRGPGYDAGYPPRSPYDDRRGMSGAYGQERRPYPNGYDRRPPYDDRGAYPEPVRGGYDDRMAPAPVGYDDRRPMAGDRRPLIEEQGSRGPAPVYDRGSSNEMFSRRDTAPKSLMGGGGGGYGERDYGASSGGNYAPMGGGNSGGYGGSTGYGAPAAPYGSGASGGYGDGRGAGAVGYGGGAPSGGYSNTAGGYNDGYGNGGRSGAYDSAYPALPPQRGFSSGNGSGPGPRRDNPMGSRRF